jgi:two-component system CheB/CheR fusion protein
LKTLKKPTKKATLQKAETAPAFRSRNFPIVGVGASAGGVEAFTQMLNALSEDTGMSFVLVQHLDSRHASVLPEVLSRATKMPVGWAEKNQLAEPNRIYIIPPNCDLSIADGHLQIGPRTNTEGLHLPIDRFMRSLAADRGGTAIGVILSGTASDGTLGLKAIKAEGGITFAQSEESAKYPSMPASAIGAGCVDYVLTPDAIARELARIGKHPYLHLREPTAAKLAIEGDGELSKLFYMLRNKTGVDFTHYKPSTIRRRIARRMVVQKIERFQEYLRFVKDHPNELQALYQDILINVTNFFRDPEMYRAMRRSVFPRLMRKRAPDDAVRIWVPGCSTGEEAYSIGIALSEYMREHAHNTPIQVFATDISDAAIERARAGVYPESIAADVPADLLRRYFTSSNSAYQVTRNLRDVCVFARQNVVRDAPFSRLDLISCRNVLIYLNPVLQRRAMSVFHYALKANGYLVLGSSETVGAMSDLFTMLDKKNKIFSKKGGASRIAVEFPPAEPAPPPTETARREPQPWNTLDVGREADRILIGRYAPPGVVIDEGMKVIQFRGRVGRYLEPEPGEANLNLFRMAREGLLPDLRTAVHRAEKKGSTRVEGVQVRYNGGFLNLAIEVIPFGNDGRQPRHFLVLFDEAQAAPQPATRTKGKLTTESSEVRRLKQELTAAKQYLQSIIEAQEAGNEELKSANEEIQSSNEELQSTNEEMETAKEELQSTNEELTTVNEELQTRNLELAHLNNDLSNLLSSVQIPLVMVDSDLRLRRFTPAAERLLNLIPTDVGRPLLDIKPNIEVPDLSDSLRDVIDNLRTVEREVEDSAGKTFSMIIRPYRTSEHKIDGAVLAFVDVSALKTSLAQSRDLREYAEAIAATVREPFLALDADLRVITANSPFYSMFSLTRERVQNVSIFEIGDGEWDIPALRDWLGQTKTSFVQGMEVERNFGAAGHRALSMNVRRIPATGKPRLSLIAIEDITARVALRESQANFSTFAREVPVGVLQADRDAQCTFINPHACRIVGLEAQPAQGRGWTQYIHPDDLSLFLAKEQRARDTNEGFSAELRFILPAGHLTWAHLILIPLAKSNHSFHGYMAALTDITERKDLEDRLMQAQKMEAVGRLAGGVAHDFNNMLTAISSYASQLLRKIPEQDPAYKPAEQIGKVVDQASTVTRQLLAFSRKQLLRPTRVDLNQIVGEMHELLKRLLGDQIDIEVSTSPEKEVVLVDVGQVQQVILNVAINARDAMAKGGRLTLATSHTHIDDHDRVAPGDYVVLSVTDTGIGMDKETRERLFEPFFTTKPPGAGTGLGLSMVYGIVQQSGGTITVESEPGKGATFSIYLPKVTGASETESLAVAQTDHRGTETILIVEDAAVVRNLVRELLEERGYTVLEARDATEAISIAENHDGEIQLLLTDLVMPRIGGHELAKRIRRKVPNLKVIYMSGYSGEALHAIEKEVNFLEKPFKPDHLAECVRNVLDGK